MSTTRTNDKALTKKQITALKKQLKTLEAEQKTAKAELATLMVKAFLQSKYNYFTEVMYLFHTPEEDGITKIDVKIGRTSLRGAIVRRTGYQRTYAKTITFSKDGRKSTDPLSGAIRKKFDPLPDDEFEQLKIEIDKHNKEHPKDEWKLDNFVIEKHDEWKTLYLASPRFGDQEYDGMILECFFVFPYIYDEETRQWLGQSYWEKRVQAVLEDWRNKHRITETVSHGFKLRSGKKPSESKIELRRAVTNSSDKSERCLLSLADYNDYIDLYYKTCIELGGIPIDFTKNYQGRHQIPDVMKEPDWEDNFAAEITKCTWEGIQEELLIDSESKPTETAVHIESEESESESHYSDSESDDDSHGSSFYSDDDAVYSDWWMSDSELEDN